MKLLSFSSPLTSTPGAAFITRRQMLAGAAAVTVTGLLQGCGSSSSSGNPSPASQLQPQPSGPLRSASLAVSATTAGTIGPAFAGLSYEKRELFGPLFSASNSDLIALFKLLGPSLLRIGGNSVDQTYWNPNGPGQTVGQIAPSDVDALAAFVKAAGWQVLYGVNLGGAGPAPYTSGSLVAKTTPALAAEEVAYAAQAFGSSLLGIEIGNEPDAYGSTYFAGTTWNVSAFESLWNQFRTAILAQTPGVAVTGPADSYNYTGWTIPFGKAQTKSKISLLTQHYYRGDAASAASTVELLVSPDTNLTAELSALHSAAQSIGVPYRIAECNSFYGNGPSNVTDAYASALWGIDFLFDCAQASTTGANFHGGGKAPYTPIENGTDGSVLQICPLYYGMLFFSLAGQGTLDSVQLSADGLEVTAYAIHTSSGGLNIMVLNKDSTYNLQLDIQLPQPISSATLLELAQLSQGAAGPSLSATDGITIQGGSVSIDGSFAPGPAYTLNPDGMQLECYVPALGAVLLQCA